MEPLAWDDPGGCEHEWGDEQRRDGPKKWDTSTGEIYPNQTTALNVSQGAFCLRCFAWRGSLGLEPTPDLFVQHLVEVFREIRRVLRDDGTMWLNLGDAYASSGQSGETFIPGVSTLACATAGTKTIRQVKGRAATPSGLKPKDLIGLPWRVAFALQADGWYLRSDIIWSKPNPMPESVTDRPTRSHEYLFLLAKSATYYYDAEAVREPWTSGRDDMRAHGVRTGAAYIQQGPVMDNSEKGPRLAERNQHDYQGGRNRRTVWEIATAPFPEAHFATFPPNLVKPCILAGTSERGACPACGAQWQREKERTEEPRKDFKGSRFDAGKTGSRDGGNRTQPGERFVEKMIGWRSTCACGRPENDNVPCVVLDPFSGAGTTALVAKELGRVGVGIELKPEYLAMAAKRVAQGQLL